MYSLQKPTKDVTVPVTEKLGNKFILEFSILPNSQFGAKTPIVDISLTSIHVHSKPTHATYCQLSNIVIEYVRLNDAILYLYYDIKDNIKRRNIDVSPQLFRCKLFGCLINRYCPSDFLVKNVIIKDEEVNHHYITLIATIENRSVLDLVYSEAEKLDKA